MSTRRDEILAVVAEEARLDPERLVPDASLASLGIASLDVVSVLFAIEDRFHVEIQPEEMAGVETVAQFVDRIEARIDRG